jgi:hypothetical protein
MTGKQNVKREAGQLLNAIVTIQCAQQKKRFVNDLRHVIKMVLL